MRSLYAKIRIKILAEFLGGFYESLALSVLQFLHTMTKTCQNAYKNLRLPESGLFTIP